MLYQETKPLWLIFQSKNMISVEVLLEYILSEGSSY